MAIALKKETANKLLQLIRDKKEFSDPETTFPRGNNIQFVFIEGDVVPSSSSSSSGDGSDTSGSSDESSEGGDCGCPDDYTLPSPVPTTFCLNVSWSDPTTATPLSVSVNMPFYSITPNDCGGSYQVTTDSGAWSIGTFSGTLFGVTMTLQACDGVPTDNSWTFAFTKLEYNNEGSGIVTLFPSLPIIAGFFGAYYSTPYSLVVTHDFDNGFAGDITSVTITFTGGSC